MKAVSKYISPFTEQRNYFPNAHYLSKETFLENVGYRMSVLEHVLSDTEITTMQIEHIRVNAYPLYTHDDIDSLLDAALKCAEPEIASKWIRCINTAFWNVDINSFSEKINRLNAKYPYMIKNADDIQTYIEQSRFESKRMQEEWQTKDEIRQQKAEDKQRKIDKEIKKILKTNEIPADLFWNISNWLDSEGGHAVLSSPDLRESTGWKKLNENEKKSLIKLAFRFLNECEFQKSNVKSYNIPITIAQAFILMYYNDKNKFEMISESVWKKYGFELLKIPFNDFLELLAPVYDYFKINYTELAGQTILEVLDQELEKDHVWIISNWGNSLTDDIVNKIIKRIGKDDVTLDSQYSVLSSLAKFGFTDDVVVFLNGILTEDIIFEQRFFKHLGLLFNLSPQHSTKFILNRIKTDVEWGRSWVEAISGRDEYSLYNGSQKCRPEEIAEFYIWLEQEYPPSTQPEHEGVYSPGALDNIHFMKNHLLRHLSGSGEIGASEAIQKIISRYPDKEWLKDCLFEAEAAELNQKTSNISISDLKELSLSRSENKLLINNIYDLHRVVLDSLDDYQQYLQGDNPAVRDLWDTKNNPVPKNEEDLSDHIQRYLKFKLTSEMIVNREVAIRRKLYKEGKSGSIPDLLVQVANKNIGQLSLCIEVKCNWNDSAETAIKKQLIDKYMSGGTAHAGILLLGWFDCDKWGESDPRKKKVKDVWTDINSAESDLVKQAEAERNNGHFVSSKVIDCSIE